MSRVCSPLLQNWFNLFFRMYVRTPLPLSVLGPFFPRLSGDRLRMSFPVACHTPATKLIATRPTARNPGQSTERVRDAALEAVCISSVSSSGPQGAPKHPRARPTTMTCHGATSIDHIRRVAEPERPYFTSLQGFWKSILDTWSWKGAGLPRQTPCDVFPLSVIACECKSHVFMHDCVYAGN